MRTERLGLYVWRAVIGLMEISYEPANRAYWHLNCEDQRHAPPMRVAQTQRGERLMECVTCKQRGWYQAGWVGLARVVPVGADNEVQFQNKPSVNLNPAGEAP